MCVNSSIQQALDTLVTMNCGNDEINNSSFAGRNYLEEEFFWIADLAKKALTLLTFSGNCVYHLLSHLQSHTVYYALSTTATINTYSIPK